MVRSLRAGIEPAWGCLWSCPPPTASSLSPTAGKTRKGRPKAASHPCRLGAQGGSVYFSGSFVRVADRLGRERPKLEAKMAENTQEIIDRLPEAQEAGVPLDTFAKLVGVSRPTLYKWKEAHE